MHSDKYAEIGDRQNGNIFQDLPGLVQELATAASQARQTWWALERACTQAHADVPDQYETLAVLELQSYRSWQEIEHMADEAYAWIHRSEIAVDQVEDDSRITRALGVVSPLKLKGARP